MSARFWVSYRSVVHRADSKCGGPLTERYPWSPESPMDWDRACLNCLPQGLPTPTRHHTVADTLAAEDRVRAEDGHIGGRL